jgi:8-oxo-dGTP diphosphatase
MAATPPAGTKARQIVEVAAAVILRPDGAFLLGRRAADTFYPGYWEFPGGKLEAGETPRQALVRELREELGMEVVRAYPWITREHHYEHAHVRLHFFRVPEWRGEIRDHIHAALAWQRLDEAVVAPMLPANGPVLRALALPDFYGITHGAEIGSAQQIELAARALGAGLRLIQVREPALPPQARLHLAVALVSSARQQGARVLVNGDEDLARAVAADGVHLTSRQLMAAVARPDFPLVGASCHDEAELARASHLALDFALLGPVLPTASHPGRQGMGWEAFAAQIAHYPLPVFAIGGLRRHDLEHAWEHGAHGIAAIRGTWSDQDNEVSSGSDSGSTQSATR